MIDGYVATLHTYIIDKLTVWSKLNQSFKVSTFELWSSPLGSDLHFS